MELRAILFAFMAAMMTFVACDKDDDKTDDVQSMADNTVSYDGRTYKIDVVEVNYFHSELTLVDAYSSEVLENGKPTFRIEGIHIMPELWNKNVDLANMDQWSDGMMVEWFVDGAFTISYHGYYNGDKGLSGSIEGQQFENESIFSSGTFRVSGNNDGTPITITIDGKLKNGKTLQLKIVSDKYLD